MLTRRRAFLGMAATAGLLAVRPAPLVAQIPLPPSIDSAERMQRIAKAQSLDAPFG